MSRPPESKLSNGNGYTLLNYVLQNSITIAATIASSKKKKKGSKPLHRSEKKAKKNSHLN
jgi:hypothetical protein